MANVMRHRRETCKQRWYNVASATVIEIGDLLYLDSSNEVKTVDLIGFNIDLAKTQAKAKLVFVGIAADASAAGDTEKVGVDTAGISELNCASATFNTGDLVGIAKVSGINKLDKQAVVAVAEERCAIGRVYQQYDSNTTSVQIELFSTVADKPAPNYGPSEVCVGSHVVTAAEQAALRIGGIETGFQGPITGITFEIRRSDVNVREDAAVDFGVLSAFYIDRGAATYVVTTGDVVDYVAWRA